MQNEMPWSVCEADFNFPKSNLSHSITQFDRLQDLDGKILTSPLNENPTCF